ncbi:MAG: cobalt transporter CbiM [Clostridiaceae bacterium]
MHIPDNYLSVTTCVVLTAAMVPVWRKSVRKVNEEISKERLPLIGIGASLSFLVMMFNVPIPGGTTGHAVGAVLLAILLGPYSATIAISVALLIQALLFGDGGILSFGANCFNMAFIMPFSGYYIYSFIKSKIRSKKGEKIAAFISSYLALNIAAFFTAIEFGIQPILFKDAQGMPLYCPYGLGISIPAMMIPHLLIAGLIEGMFTLGVLEFIKKTSPEIIYKDDKFNFKPLKILIGIMIVLTPLGLLASGTAWGEWGKSDIASTFSKGKILGYVPNGMENGINFNAILADYSLNSMPEVLAYIVSAIIAVSLFTILFKLIFNIKKSKV